MAAMKAATCGSTFAHTHRGSGIRCSSSQKSAGPAGQQLLREARAAPGRALAEQEEDEVWVRRGKYNERVNPYLQPLASMVS